MKNCSARAPATRIRSIYSTPVLRDPLEARAGHNLYRSLSRLGELMRALILPVTPFQQNCSIVWNENNRRAAVVDPGGDLDRVLSQLDKEGLTLEKILLTHAHLDHAAGTAELAKLKSVAVEGPHEGDKFWIDGLPEATRRYGFPPAEVFTPDRWLQQGDTVTIGGETLEVFHCPGHTPGHVVFFQKTQPRNVRANAAFSCFLSCRSAS